MKEPFEKLTATDTGEYLSWYTNDVREAENQGFQVFYSCMDEALKLILGAASLLFIRWEILALTLAVSGISFYTGRKFSDKVERYSGRVSGALGRYTDRIKEQIAGLSVTQAFGLEERFDEEIKASGEEMEAERCSFAENQGKENYKAMVISILGINAINMLTFVLCVLRIIAPEIIFGSLNLTNQVGNSFGQLMSYRLKMAGARPYFAKGELDECEENRSGQELPALENEIKVENLTFSYGEKEVLKEKNLVFKKGGKYAIVGKSGCGKTTLLKLLLGQIRGYQGKILYDGKELSAYDADTFYRQMAYIEQSIFLFDRSVRDNITLGDEIDEKSLDDALARSALKEEVRKFPEGLETRAGENGKNLSGGQKQRIAVARALAHNRQILLVDEGTSALDKENARVVEQALLKCRDLTLILITHHLQEENLSLYDKVYRME